MILKIKSHKLTALSGTGEKIHLASFKEKWWLSAKEYTCQCGRHRFDPWVRKIPWRRKWLLTLVFLPSESHGQRSLVGYSSWGHKELDMTEQLSTHTHTHSHT